MGRGLADEPSPMTVKEGRGQSQYNIAYIDTCQAFKFSLAMGNGIVWI